MGHPLQFTKRFLVLWRTEGQLRVYKTRVCEPLHFLLIDSAQALVFIATCHFQEAFETFKQPISVYDVKSFSCLQVDMEASVLEIRQWKGVCVRACVCVCVCMRVRVWRVRAQFRAIRICEHLTHVDEDPCLHHPYKRHVLPAGRGVLLQLFAFHVFVLQAQSFASRWSLMMTWQSMYHCEQLQCA